MNKEIADLLNEEICREFKELEHHSSGSKEQTIAVNNVIKLCQLTIEQEKSQADIEVKRSEKELAQTKESHDYDIKNRQLEMSREKAEEEKRLSGASADILRKENLIKWGIEIAGIVLPLIFYAVWLKRGFEFERTGTYTSSTFRHLFNNFKPVKK